MTKDEAIAKLFACLADNLGAWQDEEESVQEEHEDLISETDALLDAVKAAIPAEVLFPVPPGATAPLPWQDDPDYPSDDWRVEVANNDTRRGYRDWVAARREADGV
jgi:hypothetical protein